jgi:hypothetical protein
MKTLEIDSRQQIINDETLVNTDSLLEYVENDNFHMVIYGFSRTFKGHGHYEICIECHYNGEWEYLKTTTTNMMDLDNVYSDINNDDEIKQQAESFENLISEIFRDNSHLFEEITS